MILFLFFCSCSNLFNSPNHRSSKFRNKTIAVLPFEVFTSVKHLPQGVSLSMLDSIEKRKGYVMQRDLYRYLLRESVRVRTRVKLQNVNETNLILKKRGISNADIFKMPEQELAQILNVDIIISCNLYQYKKRLNRNEDNFKNHNGINNKISTILYVYERETGRLEWKYDKSQSGFPSNYAPDAIKGLLRKAAREFPF